LLTQFATVIFQALVLNVYFTTRFYAIALAMAALFIFGWLFSLDLAWPLLAAAVFLVLCVADAVLLFFSREGVNARRIMSERLSNGDANRIEILLKNHYPFAVRVRAIEEWPVQFQMRNNAFRVRIAAKRSQTLAYALRPILRGDYAFGHSVLLSTSPLQLLVRRQKSARPQVVAVYPSFLQMRKLQLLAASAQQAEAGTKQLRRMGHSLEFEHVKAYVPGDDRRLINPKATARRGNLMVNQYVDEKSQQIYCLLDMGRLMKMPFDGLSLLDYAINAALVLCNVSLQRQDRFGLMTFSHKPGPVVAASRQAVQLERVLKLLYKLDTQFLESDYEKLYVHVRAHIKQRSLIVLFTNFESLGGLKRQLPYLKQLNKHHLLLVVFFENTALKAIAEQPTDHLEGVYTKTIAAKFVFEKKMVVKELQQHGILSLLVPPQQLTVRTVNKYLELKSRQAI
jgi:uncharacterized protein (DUF58 family)